jgi:hypothetical protein
VLVQVVLAQGLELVQVLELAQVQVERSCNHHFHCTWLPSLRCINLLLLLEDNLRMWMHRPTCSNSKLYQLLLRQWN